MSNAIGVVGVDGITPIYAADARFAIWSIEEIYRGELGLNKHIPKLNVLGSRTFNRYYLYRNRSS